nr:MAG TPA: hypothetical protein [Caudoviricetes sp.]
MARFAVLERNPEKLSCRMGLSCGRRGYRVTGIFYARTAALRE